MTRNMLKDIIESIGTRKLARACGVSAPTVTFWKCYGLPRRVGRSQGRRAHYEKAIAREAGIPVKELRRMLAEEDRQRAA